VCREHRDEVSNTSMTVGRHMTKGLAARRPMRLTNWQLAGSWLTSSMKLSTKGVAGLRCTSSVLPACTTLPLRQDRHPPAQLCQPAWTPADSFHIHRQPSNTHSTSNSHGAFSGVQCSTVQAALHSTWHGFIAGGTLNMLSMHTTQVFACTVRVAQPEWRMHGLFQGCMPNPPPVKDDDLVGDVKGLLLVVRDQDAGDPHALNDLAHTLPHALPDLRRREEGRTARKCSVTSCRRALGCPHSPRLASRRPTCWQVLKARIEVKHALSPER
jgi:hypothetical protein